MKSYKSNEMVPLSACSAGILKIVSEYQPFDSKNFKSTSKSFKTFINNVASCSPYINSLLIAEEIWLSENLNKDPFLVLSDIMRVPECQNKEELSIYLRQAKRRAMLTIGLADLGGLCSLKEVTKMLSSFADFVLSVSLDYLTFWETMRNGTVLEYKKTKASLENAQGSAEQLGVFIIGLGKLGACELNYSSDIDIIILFDEALYFPDFYSDVRTHFIVIARQLVKLLSGSNENGFVFRVDLRLRPDPSSTPVCIGLNSAERYYESFGRTWERAAFIKARIVCGDLNTGRKFLTELVPFVWRKHLDFNSINDINQIREKIRDHHRLSGPISVQGHNLKLGRGGIRDIEFFVQTQQLICGGKDLTLRKSGTLDALDSIRDSGWISNENSSQLKQNYEYLRQIEHKLQLLHNQQTHSIPIDNVKIIAISALNGLSDVSALLEKLLSVLVSVETLVEKLCFRGETLANDISFVKTYLDQDPKAYEFVCKWPSYPALRSERAQHLFGLLKPVISEQIYSTKNPIETLYQFDSFLKNLPSGVQLFSLFEARPNILSLLIDVCGAAPAFAEYLGKNVKVFDSVLTKDFYSDLPDSVSLVEELSIRLNGAIDYEDKLDICRIWAKEKQFQTGIHMLRGLSSITQVAVSYSNIAETCIKCIYPVVCKNFAERYGPLRGEGIAIIAMGKLGSREMTFTSDLDLIIIYDPGDGQLYQKHQLSDSAFYARLTQAFISSLTVATANGTLYKVDMRLRPSGRHGPIASSLQAFVHYQKHEAWLWERLALSRSRVLLGKKSLMDKLNTVKSTSVTFIPSWINISADIKSMREKLQIDETSLRNILEVKKGVGRLLDLELLIQMGAVITRSIDHGSPLDLIKQLNKKSFFSLSEAKLCSEAYILYAGIQQVSRLISSQNLSVISHSVRYQTIFENYFGLSDVETLIKKVEAYAAKVNKLFIKKLI